VRAALIYPPSTYFHMPYLGPFLLKGYLQSQTTHTAETIDLNAEFHSHTRSPAYVEDHSSVDLGRPGELIRQLVCAQAQESFDALRRVETYFDWGAVRGHARVLEEVGGLIRRTDHALRAAADRPASLAEELALHSRLSHGRFLDGWVQVAPLDEFDVVGITVAYTEQLLPAMLLASLIRARRPSLRIIIGGGAVTHLLTRLVASPEFYDYVDYAVPFEGEVVLAQLLDALAEGTPLPTTNLAFRGRDGRVTYRENLLAKPRVNPVPDFSDLRAVHYPTPSPIFPLLTSKGCYWGKCAFCTHHEGYGQGYYRMTDQSVQESIDHVSALGGDHFYFVDEAIPPRQFQQLTAMFKKLQRAHYAPRWMAEARLERGMVRQESMRLLEESGCVLLVNGVESGCQEIVDQMDKGIDLNLVSEFSELCLRSQTIRTGWMFFVGFPGESQDQARETFRFIERNLQSVDYASIGAFSLERGSPIWNDPLRYGITTIHGRDDPRRSFFDYDLEGVGRRSAADNERLLAEIRAEFPGLKKLTEAAVDRSFAMFRPPRDVRLGAPSALSFSWRDDQGREVTYFADRRRFEIERSAAVR
jgi:radical SAM superfamily enzyme YgiQ (UPF0313 family)